MRKGFLIVFVTFSIMHLAEDMVWAFLARYTSVSFLFLIGGILTWALIQTLILDKTPLKKFLSSDKRPH